VNSPAESGDLACSGPNFDRPQFRERGRSRRNQVCTGRRLPRETRLGRRRARCGWRASRLRSSAQRVGAFGGWPNDRVRRRAPARVASQADVDEDIEADVSAEGSGGHGTGAVQPRVALCRQSARENFAFPAAELDTLSGLSSAPSTCLAQFRYLRPSRNFARASRQRSTPANLSRPHSPQNTFVL